MKKQLFDSFEEVVEAFGEDNLVVITFMPQIIFYLSNFNIQPVWTTPSEVNDNKLAFYFIKAETKKPYEAWQKRRLEKEHNKSQSQGEEQYGNNDYHIWEAR